MNLRSLPATALLALATLPPWAHADSREMPARAMPPAYVQECGACHMAFPPGMLPARSWGRLMAGLDKHYGTDAALDEPTRRAIDAWLQAHAGTSKRVHEEPPQERLTRSAWFERKHREVAPEVWKRPAVNSRANCMACHTRADQGDFDDDRVRIPQ